jgi:alkylhydroperoxidase/carboxymuconolactone decarboxylase family protein YurZ|tara:strand:- start:222 stop:392 length:171 start_codon:yes stop_codon:yes gene_type:complete
MKLKPKHIEDALLQAERHLDDCWFEDRGSRAIQKATETLNSIKAAIAVGEEYEPDF